MKLYDIACQNFGIRNPKLLGAARKHPTVLVVAKDAPAVETARRAEKDDIELIFLEDSEGKICGVFVPDRVKDRLAHHLQIRKDTLSKCLVAFSKIDSERRDDYHHEWLTDDRIEVYICPGDGGHPTIRYPCPRHP